LAKKADDRPESGAKVAEALEEVAGKPLFLSGQLAVDLTTQSQVGRESQMAALWRFLDQAESGELAPASVTLITGLQGSGRHRALGAIEKDMAKREWRVLNWFFHRGGDPLDTLATVLSELARSFADDAGAGGALQALERVGELPGVAASERIQALVKAGNALITYRVHKDAKPVAFLLRGLHNAGPVGIEVLVQLRDKLRGGGVRMVFIGDLLATHDDDESLTRNRLSDASRILLPPLGIQQVALLVGSLLKRRPPPGSLARQIHQASGGMPAYVEDVVRGMVDRGLLRVQGRDPNRIEWAQQDELEIPIPERARNRVVEALAELSADRRRTLEVIALLDGQTSVGVLAAALGAPVDELAEPLEDLRRRGWIVMEDRGKQVVSLRQLLAESVVLERMHPCRRRLLERRLVEQVADDPAFAAQINLLLEVGRLDDAMDRALDWSVHHIAKDCPETALRVLDQVIPHAGLAPIGTSDKARLYLMHVTALLMARPTDTNTSRSLVQASKLGRGEGEHFEAELHLLRARIQRVIGHYPNFRKHLMEAWCLVEHAPPTSLAATVADLLGWSNRAAGAVDAAATWHGRSRRIAVQLGVPVVRARADVGVAGWQFARGLLAESEQTAAAAIEVFKAVNDLRGLSNAVPIWSASLRAQGRFSEALDMLNEQTPRMRESEAPSLYVRCVMATAWAEVDVCRLGRAQECVDELAATLGKGEHLDLRLQADLVWGRILLASGQYQEAVHRLHHVRSRAKNAGLRIIAASANALVGEALWALGDEQSSLTTLNDAIDSLQRAGHVPATAAACASRARAMGHRVDAGVLFEPVLNYIETQPCVALHIEGTLASARFAAAHKQDSSGYLQRATDALDRISQGLSATDRAALSLHPWSREVRVSKGSA
jgi:tetratricopeptide (TPR) repeat protein